MRTYRNILRERQFTVSFPRPTEIVASSLAASPRCEDGTKPVLALLPRRPATTVDGSLDDSYLYLECTLHSVLDGFGANSLIVGAVVAASTSEDYFGWTTVTAASSCFSRHCSSTSALAGTRRSGRPPSSRCRKASPGDRRDPRLPSRAAAGQGLEREQVRRVVGACRIARFSDGETILEEGGLDATLFILLNGEADIRRAGARHRVQLVRTGECPGDMSLLTGQPHSASAVAVQPTDVATLGHGDLTWLIRARPDIGLVIFRNLAIGLGATGAHAARLMSGDGVARTLRKNRPQMPAKHTARVRGGEDAHEMAVLGDQRAADVLGGHVLEHVVERLARIDDCTARPEHVANEQLLLRRQAEAWVERPLQVPVSQHADERVAPVHGQMPDLVTDHDLSRVEEAVVVTGRRTETESSRSSSSACGPYLAFRRCSHVRVNRWRAAPVPCWLVERAGLIDSTAE